MIFKQVKHPCQVVLEVEGNAVGTAECLDGQSDQCGSLSVLRVSLSLHETHQIVELVSSERRQIHRTEYPMY